MYIPPHFYNPDIQAALQLVKELQFGILVSIDKHTPVAAHIPFDLLTDANGKPYLWGHLARANEQWRSLAGQRALAIFSTPGSYISPSWYGHLNVPTANYIAVHIYGNATLIDDPEELVKLLAHSTSVREKENGDNYRVGNLPPGFLKKEMRGLVGFTLSIDEVLPNFKLSQNRNAADFSNIISKLKERGTAADTYLAEKMEALGKPEKP